MLKSGVKTDPGEFAQLKRDAADPGEFGQLKRDAAGRVSVSYTFSDVLLRKRA